MLHQVGPVAASQGVVDLRLGLLEAVVRVALGHLVDPAATVHGGAGDEAHHLVPPGLGQRLRVGIAVLEEGAAAIIGATSSGLVLPAAMRAFFASSRASAATVPLPVPGMLRAAIPQIIGQDREHLGAVIARAGGDHLHRLHVRVVLWFRVPGTLQTRDRSAVPSRV